MIQLMPELIKIYGETFSNIIIENSDELSGLNKIKKNFSYNDLVDLKESLNSQNSFSFQNEISEKYGEITVLNSIKKLNNYVFSLTEKITKSIIEKDQKSEKLFEENEDSVIKTMLIKYKKNIPLEQLKAEGNENVFSQVKEIARGKWTKAYTLNLNDSIAKSYSTFEYNILTDPVITTLKLL